jgi:hypothetical protein
MRSTDLASGPTLVGPRRFGSSLWVASVLVSPRFLGMVSLSADLAISADGSAKLSLKSRRSVLQGSDVSTLLAPCDVVVTGKVRVDLHVNYAKTHFANPRFIRVGEQAGRIKNILSILMLLCALCCVPLGLPGRIAGAVTRR